MSQDLYYFLMGAGGAASAEVFKLYDYKHKLTSIKYRLLAKSRLFWGVVISMLIFSGFVCWAIAKTAESSSKLQLLISGVAARSFVRGAATASSRDSSIELGNQAERITLRDVFV